MEGLGTLTGGDHSRALAINELGDIVGVSDSPVGNRAVLWTRHGEMWELNQLIPAGSNFVLTEAVSIKTGTDTREWSNRESIEKTRTQSESRGGANSSLSPDR